MILNYEKEINDSDQYDGIPIINSFSQISGVINGKLNNDNISNTAELTIKKMQTTEDLIVGKYEFGQAQEIPENKKLVFGNNAGSIMTISEAGVEIG